MPPTTVTRREAPTPPSPETVGAEAAVTRDSSSRKWLRTALPTLLVIGALIGIAAWGHSTDWTLPKFSALVAGGDKAAQCSPGEEGWCKEHNVPASACIECNSKLVAPIPDFGWCSEHGIAQCPLHHPEVAQLKEVPTITDADFARASKALALLPRAENGSRCKHYQRRIQFASADAMEKAGLDIAVVEQSPLIEAITANGEVIYDQTHYARLTSRVPGTAWRVEKHLGDHVRKGDILALIDSVEVGRAKADLLQAIADVRLKQINVDRLRSLSGD